MHTWREETAHISGGWGVGGGGPEVCVYGHPFTSGGINVYMNIESGESLHSWNSC